MLTLAVSSLTAEGDQHKQDTTWDPSFSSQHLCKERLKENLMKSVLIETKMIKQMVLSISLTVISKKKPYKKIKISLTLNARKTLSTIHQMSLQLQLELNSKR